MRLNAPTCSVSTFWLADARMMLRDTQRLNAVIQRVLQRPLDVAEQDDARDVGLVLGGVNEGLVEEHVLAVAPGVRLAVDEDPAIVGVRA